MRVEEFSENLISFRPFVMPGNIGGTIAHVLG